MAATPVSTRVWESCVLPFPTPAVWSTLRGLDFAALLPSRVASSELVYGRSPDEVGSERKITYKDGSEWTVKLTELSDTHTSLSWDLVFANETVGYSSRSDSITLRSVTETNETFVEWVTDFSSDATLAVVSDCSAKQREAFKEFLTTLKPSAAAAASGAGGAGAGAGAGAASGSGAAAGAGAAAADLEWPADRVRSTFVEFFKEKQHNFIKSSPVVPHNDPTLLFTNAGMNQFKPIFLGRADPTGPLAGLKRACNSQKCIRAGGKHNDLEDVGKDVYHHTYFEMLGNWSFGDYFKEEAITWAWELLTGVYALDPARLYATYFGGSEEDGVPADDEARDIWLRFLPADRVLPFDKKDNFWEMGATGPCGPCTEIHYDRIGNREVPELVNMDDPDVLEIWNLVFMQFNRDVTGALCRLPNVHVDTGMGFERLVSVLQNKPSNYDTDVFARLFESIQELSGARSYTGKVGDEDKDHVDMAYRVVADHIRTLCFAIGDRAVPSNNDRGYVLRRVLRRGVRYGMDVLGAQPGFFHKLVPTVVEVLGGHFPELVERQEFVTEVIKEEEELFGRSLKKGVRKFNQLIKANKAAGLTAISGEQAFTLFATHGFPVDLTTLMAEEQGFTVDEEAFNVKMEEHRLVSGQTKGGNVAPLVLEAEHTAELESAGFKPTDNTLKYDWSAAPKAKVLRVLAREAPPATEEGVAPPAIPARFVTEGNSEHELVGVVLDITSFYPEMGGQCADRGFIVPAATAVDDSADGANSVLNVHDAQNFAGYTLHIGTVPEGKTVRVGDEVVVQVDYDFRQNVAPNHTMTHVLNFALRKVLQTEVDQKGSFVGADKLRFDFSSKKGLTTEQLAEVEALVQDVIDNSLPVHYQEVPLATARSINGLRSMFNETYPDPVRVVCVGEEVSKLVADPDNTKWGGLSTELCGGTHIANTASAMKFALVEETAISKGVRRATALTRNAALAAFELAEQLATDVAEARSMSPAELDKQRVIPTLTQRLNDAVISAARKAELRTEVASLFASMREFQKKHAEDMKAAAVPKLKAAVAEARASGATFTVCRVDVPKAKKQLAKVITTVAKELGDDMLPVLCVSLEDGEAGKLTATTFVPKARVAELNGSDWVKTAVAAAGGRGGGKPTGASGSCKSGEQWEAVIKAAVEFAS